jgi:hypothetical protein
MGLPHDLENFNAISLTSLVLLFVD